MVDPVVLSLDWIDDAEASHTPDFDMYEGRIANLIQLQRKGQISIGMAIWKHESGEWSPEMLFEDWDLGGCVLLPDGYGYGYEVEMGPDVLLVSEYRDPCFGKMCLARIFVLRRTDSSWTLEQIISAPEYAQMYQFFGHQLVVGNDVIFVSSPIAYSCGGEEGSVYIYRHQESGWVLEEEISELEADGAFARDIAAGEETLFVGDSHNGDGQIGAVYQYRKSGSGWPLESLILPSESCSIFEFGRDVEYQDGLVYISGKGCGDHPDGLVSVHDENSGWEWQSRFSFGHLFGIGNETIVVGSRESITQPVSCLQYKAGSWRIVAQLSGTEGKYLYKSGDVDYDFACFSINVDLGEPYILQVYDLAVVNNAAPGSSCFCTGDATSNGVVDTDDVLTVIGAWGTSDYEADVDGSGVVDSNDILDVLNGWGACGHAADA